MSERETCKDCGKSWGVTVKPRADVRCSECVRPKAWRNPVHYWGSRIWNYHATKPHFITRSPEWWNQQTDRKDLAYAERLAKEVFAR